MGYRLLLRFEDLESESDDFWVNLGSKELKYLGYW